MNTLAMMLALNSVSKSTATLPTWWAVAILLGIVVGLVWFIVYLMNKLEGF